MNKNTSVSLEVLPPPYLESTAIVPPAPADIPMVQLDTVIEMEIEGLIDVLNYYKVLKGTNPTDADKINITNMEKFIVDSKSKLKEIQKNKKGGRSRRKHRNTRR